MKEIVTQCATTPHVTILSEVQHVTRYLQVATNTTAYYVLSDEVSNCVFWPLGGLLQSEDDHLVVETCSRVTLLIIRSCVDVICTTERDSHGKNFSVHYLQFVLWISCVFIKIDYISVPYCVGRQFLSSDTEIRKRFFNNIWFRGCTSNVAVKMYFVPYGCNMNLVSACNFSKFDVRVIQ